MGLKAAIQTDKKVGYLRTHLKSCTQIISIRKTSKRDWTRTRISTTTSQTANIRMERTKINYSMEFIFLVNGLLRNKMNSIEKKTFKAYCIMNANLWISYNVFYVFWKRSIDTHASSSIFIYVRNYVRRLLFEVSSSHLTECVDLFTFSPKIVSKHYNLEFDSIPFGKDRRLFPMEYILDKPLN